METLEFSEMEMEAREKIVLSNERMQPYKY